MKIQHLAVIFVIIIIPISLVLSLYINNHISTIEKQTQYTTKLINATYDMAKAFQLNTFNNRYSTLNNSKIRDIEASISTFYRTLGTNMGTIGYGAYDLQSYTPAILCTLYDGYYIYTKYNDIKTDDNILENDDNYTYGLKPFISYSCRYVSGNNYDFVVNYTLDNTITIIGKVNGTYVTKTGHLVVDATNPISDQGETLSERLITIEGNDSLGNPTTLMGIYEYVIYGNEKIYKDNNNDANGNPRYFRYSTDYRKNYVSSASYDDINAFFNDDGKKSAYKYYEEAIDFTNWVKTNIGNIKPNNAKDLDGNAINFSSNIDNTNIFDINADNNPLKTSSAFNEHRMNVIRYSIESNLSAAIANYSKLSPDSFAFAMPKIEEDEWYKITNNVCFVSFLQGLPIGSKTYSNYCVVANNTNQETVGTDSIYIIAKDNAGVEEYHKAGCKKLVNGFADGTYNILGAYPSSDFKRKSLSLTGADANAHSQLLGRDYVTDYEYFFPQEYTACYDCIVNIADTYSIDDIIEGTIKKDDGTTIQVPDTLRKKYLTALARTRYNLYTVNGYFGANSD